MPTTVIAGPTAGAAPITFTVPPSYPVTPLTVSAEYDGTGAAAAFVPALGFYSQDGRLLGRYGIENNIAAGGTGEVTFAPFLGRAATPLTGSGVPPYGALDDFVFANANTTVTGVGAGNGTTLLTGASFTLSGTTRVKYEFFTPSCEVTGSPPNNQAVGFDIYDGATYKGIGAYVIGNRKTDGTLLLDIGASVKMEAVFTLAAGAHQFVTKAFKNVAGGTCVVFANTFIDGTGNFGPMWQRVTTT